MDPAYEARRLVDVARALRLARRIAPRERWPRERLERHQRAALDALVRHAVAHSPFYRERLGGLVGADLQALPVLDKATMMERFDELVCDPRLRRDALFEHLDGLDRDALYLGEYRGMTTSGSSGRKGLFVYDRRGWVGILAQFFRVTTFTGARPRVPRLRVAAIGGGAPTHMTRRCADSVSVGLHRVLSLPVTMPLPRLVAALNEFRPQYLNAYPSMAALLADEQLRGRLRIAPEIVSTSSELLTPAVADRIEEAFGRRPYDLYGTTEGLWGGSCVPGGAMHLFEDMTIVEDDGDRILVTNLFNRVQPLIRFEVTDVMRFADEPCPCGRTLRKLEAVEGRADDVLRLDGVAVMPAHFSVLTADREVREFQVVQRGGDLRVRVALAEGAAVPEACTRLRDGLAGRLAALGVRSARVEIEPCDAIARAPSGKLQLVVGEPR